MKILVTGAKGFVGKNLVENLKNIRDGKKRDVNVTIETIYEYDKENTSKDLDHFCSDCDFVFSLAGINRPRDESEYQTGNFGFAEILLNSLKAHNNTCPIMLSSSVQAALIGRYCNSAYGESKKAGEELFFKYSQEIGSKVLVYRFPNIFGKWCRPNYNSVVATFCNAVANHESYTVNDRSTEIELLYIDDLISEMLDALESCEHRCDYNGLELVPNPLGRYCYAPITYKVTLGEIADLLESFREQPQTLFFKPMPDGSFEKKLYSSYLSYLPEDKMIFDLNSSVDDRGAFTEFFKSDTHGQFSINVSKPGMTKGQHWHNTKMEIFLVVSGRGIIQERKIGLDEKGQPYPVREYEVSGDKLQCVYMLPGYTHNIINLSDTDDLITVMWGNEIFDPKHPETYHEDVVIK